METLRIPAKAEKLATLQAYIGTHVQSAGLPETMGQKLELAAEEILLNTAHHAYQDGPGEMEVAFFSEAPGQACLRFTDWGPPFDPTARPDADTHQGLEDRRIGGLGLHLLKKLASRMEYQRQGHRNVLTLCFKSENKK